MKRALILMMLLAIVVLLPAPAHASLRLSVKLQKQCFVYLPDMPDGKLKRKCLRLSRRLP